MASRFLSSRDIEQFTRFNRELVGDLKRDKDGIINQLVKIFQISASDTKTNLYGEAVGGVKTFSPGVELPCTIQADDFDFNTDEFGPDLRQTVVYSFMRDTLIEADFRPEIGDITIASICEISTILTTDVHTFLGPGSEDDIHTYLSYTNKIPIT